MLWLIHRVPWYGPVRALIGRLDHGCGHKIPFSILLFICLFYLLHICTEINPKSSHLSFSFTNPPFIPVFLLRHIYFLCHWTSDFLPKSFAFFAVILSSSFRTFIFWCCTNCWSVSRRGSKPGLISVACSSPCFPFLSSFTYFLFRLWLQFTRVSGWKNGPKLLIAYGNDQLLFLDWITFFWWPWIHPPSPPSPATFNQTRPTKKKPSKERKLSKESGYCDFKPVKKGSLQSPQYLVIIFFSRKSFLEVKPLDFSLFFNFHF